MALFCIMGFDAEGSAEKRKEFLDPHLKHLQELNRQGRLFAVGPLMASEQQGSDACGSIIIVEFDTLAEATAWFNDEAYKRAGVYREVQIKPFIDAMSYC